LYSDLSSGTYNLVEGSMKIIDVVDALKQLIPDLEFIFINQHLKLHQLNVKENKIVNEKLGINNQRPVKEVLQEFLSRFSF